MARFLLGQAVIHVLKKDKHIREWYCINSDLQLQSGKTTANLIVGRVIYHA